MSVKTSNSESLASAIDMKHWFSTLSVEERVAALGFSDGPMLSTFLQLASLSGASHGNPSHQDSSQERTTDKPMKGTVLPSYIVVGILRTDEKKKRHSIFDRKKVSNHYHSLLLLQK